MKFLIPAIAIFASTAFAAKYAAGTICHSNIECEQNCLNKQYTIVNDDGGYVFVCDPGVADPMQWYNLGCITIGSNKFNKGATEAACKTVGGESCAYSCILSGKRSVDQENRGKWTIGCGKNSDGIPTQAELIVRSSEKAARIYCE
jgi:hypothetical protein